MCTYGSVDMSVCGCIRIMAPKQPERGHDWWLVYCSERPLYSQNGVQNVWLHQTCSAQSEVNEMWQTFLFRLRPCVLFHNKAFARPCQCTQLPSLWVSRHWIIHCNWAHWGVIKRVWSCFICMQCFTGTSVLCQNCLHWRNTLLQDSHAMCTVDTDTVP